MVRQQASFDLSVLGDESLRNRLAEMFEEAAAQFSDRPLTQVGEPQRRKLRALRKEFLTELGGRCKESGDGRYQEECLKAIGCLLSGFDTIAASLEEALKGAEVLSQWPGRLRGDGETTA